jgi:predicted O-methyltransferase YrrM
MLTLVAFLLGLCLAGGIALVVLQRWSIKYRGKKLLGRLPIRTIGVEEVDSVFVPNQMGPTLATEVRMIGGVAVGGTSSLEAWILAALAKNAQRMFEFGTCTGRTTYAWAANSPDAARIATLTLAPDEHETYQHQGTDHRRDTRHALRESHFQQFYYSGTDVEAKIEQLYGDSKQFDPEPYAGTCDLIFIDGSHAYSYVVSDTEKALTMLAPGGLILWHDYRGPHQAAGVYRALNELAERLPLRRIADTSLVVYRKPAAALQTVSMDAVKRCA